MRWAINLLVVLILSGCASQQVKVDPLVLRSNYDYAKPAEIADKSKPVWVLPIINKGWVPARVDPQSGDWISGHYTASVVQEGHWATLEEAELATRPFVIAGDSKPIVPVPKSSKEEYREVPPTNLGGPEPNMKGIEDKGTVLIPPPSRNATYARTDRGGLASEMELDLPITKVPQLFAVDSKAPVLVNSTLYLPAHPQSETFDLPLDTSAGMGSPKIQVHYLPQNQVEVTYLGKKYMVQLQHSDDQIKITLPKS